MENYSLSDVASVIGNNDGFGGTNSWVLIILFALIFGWGNNGMNGNSATNQEILFGQRFSGLDNKIDRIGNGIADATFSLNNSITSEGRAIQTQLADSTQKILDSMAQNKIDSLQAKVNQLEMQAAMCGTPKISPYLYNVQQNCGCGNI